MNPYRRVVGRYLDDVFPAIAGIWIVFCGLMPGDYFSVAHHALWEGAPDPVPFAVLAAALYLAAALTRSRSWRRRFAFSASIIWIYITILLFDHQIPLGGGLAAIVAIRSALTYLATPES